VSELLPYQVEVDRVTPSEWSEMLDLFRDANVYQTWSYGRVRWGEANLSHLVVKHTNQVVGIAQLRVIRPTVFKFGMAYLRWGPLCHARRGDLDLRIVEAMATSLREEYVKKRGLYLRILPNAFSGSRRAQTFQAAFSDFALEPCEGMNEYRTLLLDLSPPLEELRRALDQKWRNKLSGAERNCLSIIEGEDIELYDTFCTIYAEMRDRKRFPTTVDVEQFGRIQNDLPKNHRMKVLICQHKGQPVSALVCSTLGDCGIYLLGATSNAGLKFKGSYLLQWSVVQSLKKAGVRYYDLGGIDPVANPGGYSFKSGLPASDVRHIRPLVACERRLSAAAVNAGILMHDAFRDLRHRAFSGRDT
jgi:lipid II:glycine glycyltransferase (peptidoglycan interpeptide bridge formation enzyme)